LCAHDPQRQCSSDDADAPKKSPEPGEARRIGELRRVRHLSKGEEPLYRNTKADKRKITAATSATPAEIFKATLSEGN
jgi:hypothetical protein